MLLQYLKIKNFMQEEEGQTIVEYCVMIGLVALAIIAASPSLTAAIQNFFTRVSTSLGNVGAGS